MPAGRGDRVILALCAVVALVALAARVHDATAYPAMRDWDAGGHAVNVVTYHEGHVPSLRSWAGSHPPLYYLTGAALWALLPDAVPLHVALRLVSSLAWLVAIALVWRALRRLGLGVDAAVAATLLLGVPGFVIASAMMTNDALAVGFMTAALVRLLAAHRAGPARVGEVATTAAVAALAAMVKATGVAVVGLTLAFYAWQSRRALAVALRNVAVAGLVAAAILAPHYGRLVLARATAPVASGAAAASPYALPGYDFLAGFSESPEKGAISLVVLEVMRSASTSYARLLHEAIWDDPTAVFLPRTPSVPGRILWVGGFGVELLVVVGIVGLVRRPVLVRRAGPIVVFGLGYLAAVAVPCAVAPYMMLTKTNFLLPLALPLGLVLAVGLEGVPAAARTAVRVGAVAFAALGVAATWYGWWEPGAAASPPARMSSEPAVAAVERYVGCRARDPIRAVAALTPEFQLAHGLRLVRILRIPFPDETEPTTPAARALVLARARQAWLDLYDLIPWLQPIAAALQITVLEVAERDDGADVRVRVEARGTEPPRAAADLRPWPFPPFEQRFGLVRTGDEWRIATITQAGVSVANTVPAFVANPTLAGLDDLRALGWRPAWEIGVASALRRAF